MRILQATQKDLIRETIQVVSRGGLVVFPTDTVYGMLVDATNEDAIQKLISIKERPTGKPISVFVRDFEQMEEVAVVSTPIRQRLEVVLPGPYTVVLPSRHTVCKRLESERGTIGVRYVEHPLLRELVTAYGKPLTATSANLAGHNPCSSISALLKQLSQRRLQMIDLIVDGGDLPRRLPSTVIDLTGQTVQTLRMGDVVFDDERQFVSTSVEQTQRIAQQLVEEYLISNRDDRPICFFLEGDLGAGKTQFAKGVGYALGISEQVVSPTYVIVNEYETQHATVKTFIHADPYNIQEPEEFAHIGLLEALKKHVLACIEWADMSAPIFDEIIHRSRGIYVRIRHLNDHERSISVKEVNKNKFA